MKITRYAIILASAAGLLAGCQDLEMTKAYDPGDVVAPVLHSLPQEIAITSENMGTVQLFTWDAADFGVATQINYSIEANYGNNDRKALFTGLDGTSSEQTYEGLNSALALAAEDGGVGVPVDEPTDVNFYVSATIGTGFEKFYSEPVTVRMTVTKAERTYPKIWVIGQYCDWKHENSQFLYSFSGDEVNYEGIIDFAGKAADGFKLTGVAGWDNSCNWGLDGAAEKPAAEAASINLISDGGSANIDVYSKRFYRFAFNRTSLTLENKLSFDKIGVVGDFNGWGDDVEMNFDAAKQRFYADVDFPVDGGFKFRLNGAWDVSYGGSDGLLNSGDNIPVTAGKYRVYANLNNSEEMTYELNAADYGKEVEQPEPGPDPATAEWYVHGQTKVTPDWGATAMKSVSTNITAYQAAGVEVEANSEFLFKSGDESQWIGADKTFAGGGEGPYPVTVGSAFKVSADKVNAVIMAAGTYDYWLLPDDGRAYVTETGVKPEYVASTWGIVGNLTGWGDLGDFSMSEEGDYYVRKDVALTTATEFKIRFNNEWDDSKNYGTESEGTIDINTGVAVISSGGSNNMKVQKDGTYDIYFDLTNSKVYVMTAGQTPQK